MNEGFRLVPDRFPWPRAPALQVSGMDVYSHRRQIRTYAAGKQPAASVETTKLGVMPSLEADSGETLSVQRTIIDRIVLMRESFRKGWWLIIVWFVLSVVLSIYAVISNMRDPAFQVLGISYLVARWAAVLLRFNGFLTILFACRHFMDRVRKGFEWLGLLDHHFKIHSWLAFLCGALALFHTLAHYVNFWVISSWTYEERNERIGLVAVYAVPDIPNLFPGHPNFLVFLYLCFIAPFGLFGHISLVCIWIVIFSSLPVVRQYFFEAFQLLHFFWIPFLVFGGLHSITSIFGFPTFWFWTLMPSFILMHELYYRLHHFNRAILDKFALHVVPGRSTIMEIRIEKPVQFTYEAGDYAFLYCLSASPIELHAMTIMSSPADDYIVFGVQVLEGGWTEKLAKQLMLLCGAVPDMSKSFSWSRFNTSRELGNFAFYFTGPYRSPVSNAVNESSVVVFCCSGIGVTPYVSILRDFALKLGARPFTGTGSSPEDYEQSLMFRNISLIAASMDGDFRGTSFVGRRNTAALRAPPKPAPPIPPKRGAAEIHTTPKTVKGSFFPGSSGTNSGNSSDPLAQAQCARKAYFFYVSPSFDFLSDYRLDVSHIAGNYLESNCWAGSVFHRENGDPSRILFDYPPNDRPSPDRPNWRQLLLKVRKNHPREHVTVFVCGASIASSIADEVKTLNRQGKADETYFTLREEIFGPDGNVMVMSIVWVVFWIIAAIVGVMFFLLSAIGDAIMFDPLNLQQHFPLPNPPFT